MEYNIIKSLRLRNLASWGQYAGWSKTGTPGAGRQAGRRAHAAVAATLAGLSVIDYIYIYLYSPCWPAVALFIAHNRPGTQVVEKGVISMYVCMYGGDGDRSSSNSTDASH